VIARCRICRHPDEQEISREYLSGHSIEELTKKHKLSYWILSKHFKHLPKKSDANADPLAHLIDLTMKKLKEAELSGNLKAQTSLILALRDLQLAKNKQMEEGNDLESRFSSFCDDKEFQRYCLDALANGRGWNRDRPEWSDTSLAAESARKTQVAHDRRMRWEEKAFDSYQARRPAC